MHLIINIHIPSFTSSDILFNKSILDELVCFIEILKIIPTIKISIFNNKRYITDLNNLENSILETDLSILLLQLNNEFNLEANKEVNNKSDIKIFIISMFDIIITQKLLFLREAINKNSFKIFLFSELKNGLSLLGPVFNPSFYDFLSVFTNPIDSLDIINYPVKCKCHGNEIKYGFICPICLTPYCKKRGICLICKIKVKV